MKDNYGDKEEASPSTAVQMSGLSAVPIAGDDFSCAGSLDEVCLHAVTCLLKKSAAFIPCRGVCRSFIFELLYR